MPSERRLHPATILFALISQVREFAVPLILALFVGSRGGNAEVWALPFLVIYGGVAFGRYYSFRYRFEPHEMVVRSGIFFRNERHIPYARIQNLDAVRNVLHRALGVVDVRIDTGSGVETDARLSVITLEALEEVRAEVRAGRADLEPVAETAAPAAADVLLSLPRRELVLHGLIENRGAILIAGAFGLLWESGLGDRYMERYFGDEAEGRGLIRDLAASLSAQQGVPWDRLLVAAAALAGLLLLIRLLSILMAVIRLHGFRLMRTGDDLRAEYGLLTRVTATIPLRRIQTLTVSEGFLHRRFGRVSIRVDTAGGSGEGGRSSRRESLAPIIGRDAWPGLVNHVLPGLDLAAVPWRPAAPGALARELRVRLAMSAFAAALSAFVLGWAALGAFVLFAIWSVTAARLYVRHLGWATTGGAVLFKSGYLRRHISVALFARIQSVSLHESPFDRRRRMARVFVDTAGAGAASHRVHIPYMAREEAEALRLNLATEAAATAFRW